MLVDAGYEERYWYPDDGGEVWVAGYQLVDPGSGRYLARDAPALAAQGLHVVGVAGAGAHHAEALSTEAVAPGSPLELRRDPDNPHDPNAIVCTRGAGASRWAGFRASWPPSLPRSSTRASRGRRSCCASNGARRAARATD